MTESQLRGLLGRKFVFGVKGLRATPDEAALFARTRARGLILYRRNCQSPAQIRRLVSGLERRLGYRLLVCLDHEGGRVVMPQTGLTAFPDNYAFGRSGAGPALARLQGRLEALQLRGLGVSVNFAPVADVAAPYYNPGILSRSYGEDPRLCARLVSARIRGLQSAGICAAAKHYPGKGHATVDAHLKLPVINSTLRQLESTHLLPFFAAIKAGAKCIMSSHPLYRNIDPGGPATFSKKLITDLLRRKYGFKGVVISDALEMGAITEVADVASAAVKAELAGHDLLLVCTPGPEQERAYDAVLRHYLGGGDLRALKASARRAGTLLRRRAPLLSGQPATKRRAEKLARAVAQKAVRILQTGGLSLPLPARALATPEALAVVPRYRDIASTVMIEPQMMDMEKFVRKELGLRRAPAQFLHLPISPSAKDLSLLKRRLKGKKLALLLLWDACLVPGWRKALEAVQASQAQPVVVPGRDFHDARLLAPRSCAATAYGFRRFQTAAALRALFKSPKAA